MPQVPEYQSFIPRVPVNVGGGMRIQAPRPTIDYERTMQLAMEPIRQGVGWVEKLAEQDRARTIKAQSDEVEAQYMQDVNRRMYDPDGGFLSQQGKNAVDAYQGTMEGLESDMEERLGSLPPLVRDAVASRLNDRRVSAQTTAMRWQSQQKQQWYVSSSKARASAIIDDAAGHYADADYLAKSLGSLHQEVDYQSSLQGWGDDVKAAQLKAQRDLFEASRFGAWANDSPADAFSALPSIRGQVSEDVYHKLDASLWAQSKGTLALQLAGRVPPLRSRADIAKRVLDPSVRTGIPLIDGLSPARKAELYSTAWSYMERERAQRSGSLQRAIQNSYALAASEGVDPEPLSRDQFIEAYGEDQGALAWDDYQDTLSATENEFKFSRLPNSGISAVLDSMRPQRGSPNYAIELKLYQAAAKSAAKIIEDRKDDPIGAALDDDGYGLTPISDWSQTGLVVQELQKRSQASGLIQADYQSPAALLSKDELTAFQSVFEKKNPDEQDEMIAGITRSIKDSRSLGILASQLSDKTPVASTALFIASDGDAAIAQQYLRGKQYLKEKRASVPASGAGTQTVAAAYAALGGDEAENVKPVSDDPAITARLADAAVGLMAYGQVNDTQAVDPQEAVERVMGGQVFEWNGRMIVGPKKVTGESYSGSSWIDTDFEDLVNSAAATLSKSGTGYVIASPGRIKVKDFAANLSKMELYTVGNGRYYVVDPRYGFVLRDDGTRFVFDVNPGAKN